MEDMTDYKTKDKQYHADYLQGKRPQQYETSAILLGYSLGFVIVLIVVFGVYKIIECLIDIIRNWF